jgi:hypothetical protein
MKCLVEFRMGRKADFFDLCQRLIDWKKYALGKADWTIQGDEE